MNSTTVAVPDADQAFLFGAWRAAALERMPYFARLLFSLRVLDAPGTGTFGVTPDHRLFVDFAAVTPWGAAKCGEVLLHECSHLFAGHAAQAADVEARHGEIDRLRWNIAADLSINDDLVAVGCTHIAASGVLPGTFRFPEGSPAEVYYRRLAQHMRGVIVSRLGCGSGAGAAAWAVESDDGAATGVGADEAAIVVAATATAIVEYDKAHPGRTPGSLLRQAHAALAPPVIPWQTVLAALIRHGVQRGPGSRDVDPTRRDRRHHAATVQTSDGPRRVITFGTSSPRPRIAVVRDTSASMSTSMLAVTVREIASISRRMGVRGDDLVVLDVDAGVARTRRYTGPHDLFDATGGGGTDLRVGIAAAIAARARPTLVVVVTDGWTPWPPEPPGIPVVACLVDRSDWVLRQIPPFIKAVRVSD